MSDALRVEAPSVFAAAGAESAVLGEVGWVLLAGGAVIFVAVMALLAWTLRRGGRGRPVATAWWVVGGGIVFPVVVLSALMLYGTARTAGLERGLAQPSLVIGVTGRLWWWEVRYRDAASGREVVSANELRVPVGRSVQIALQSHDVLHSFWVPALAGKMDLVPGRVNRLVVTATRPGVHRGQCAEYCGEQHAKMALHVVALPAEEFDRWLAAEARPAPTARRSRPAGAPSPPTAAPRATRCAAPTPAARAAPT